MLAYMDSSLKNSHLSTAEWLNKSKHTRMDVEGEHNSYPEISLTKEPCRETTDQSRINLLCGQS